MTQKVAVAVVHGVGKQDKDFSKEMTEKLKERFVDEIGGRATKDDLVVKPVYWAPEIQPAEDELWKNLRQGGEMDFIALRHFLIDFAADAIAYQPTPKDRAIYDGIHLIFAETLKKLAQKAGEAAPLCVIAHSLGSAIASNYIYDLQIHPTRSIISDPVRDAIGENPLERGETLTLLYTLGSPIAIWSLRYKEPEFGVPIAVPAPLLGKHHAVLVDKAEWLNFYDRDDVLGYPLEPVNDLYKAVVKDRPINAGGFLSSWNPISHIRYWTDKDVLKPIAESLAGVWQTVNPE